MSTNEALWILSRCIVHPWCIIFSFKKVFFPFQISRLTWFTRFDPVEPKERGFSGEQSITNTDVIVPEKNEINNEGGETSSDGQTRHHRSSESLCCTSLLSSFRPFARVTVWFFLHLLFGLSRLYFICVKQPESVQIYICPLLAVWDGETEGRRRESCDSSCSWGDHLLTGGKATFTNDHKH